jgi:hypothetical protein
MFAANVLKVLIATPGDTGDEVDAITASIHSWNGRRAEAQGVILLPRHWKSDAVPLVNARGAQSVIDSQLVDSADIVIAVFDSRLGQATEDAVSGTAHEIERTTEAGKPVHVYFSDEPISRSADPAELARLNKFRKEMESKGLLGVYADPTDLGYQVREAIEHDLMQMSLGVDELPVAAAAAHAIPRLTYDGNKKQLLVENKSDAVGADQLVLEVEGAEGNDDGETFLLEYDGEPVDLLPLSTAQWPLILFWQSPRQANIIMRWLENGEPRQERQTVFFH